MAKIYGVKIKNLKTFHGHEGDCAQGSLYMDGKKIGFWSQDSCGGPDDFDVSKKDFEELQKRAVKYYTNFPQIDTLQFYKEDVDPSKIDFTNLPKRDPADICEIESYLIAEILERMQTEKVFKSMQKKGHKYLATINCISGSWPIPKTIYTCYGAMSEAQARKCFAKELELPYVSLKMYGSVDDFVTE